MRIATATLVAALAIACQPGGTTNLSGQVIVEDEAGSPPTCATSTAAGELCVEGDVEANGALDIAGASTMTGDVTLAGGAGALTFSDSASSIVIPDADSTALDIGATGATTMMRFATTDDAEYVLFGNGIGNSAVSITDTISLDASDCGKPLFVTAGIDTKSITLPALSAVPAGCTLRFFYVGADAGALVDISPNSADGIEGTCTLAASIVTFSGTDDADIGLTKASSIQGDSITLVSGNADDWYVSACSGIWANN